MLCFAIFPELFYTGPGWCKEGFPCWRPSPQKCPDAPRHMASFAEPSMYSMICWSCASLLPSSASKLRVGSSQRSGEAGSHPMFINVAFVADIGPRTSFQRDAPPTFLLRLLLASLSLLAPSPCLLASSSALLLSIAPGNAFSQASLSNFLSTTLAVAQRSFQPRTWDITACISGSSLSSGLSATTVVLQGWPRPALKAITAERFKSCTWLGLRPFAAVP